MKIKKEELDKVKITLGKIILLYGKGFLDWVLDEKLEELLKEYEKDNNKK